MAQLSALREDAPVVGPKKKPGGSKLTPRDRFAYNLRRRRIEVGISQEVLGERTELHRTEISLLDRAGREPRYATLLKLCGALLTTPDLLCEGTEWDHERRQFTVMPPNQH